MILVIALQSLVGVIDANQPHHPAVVHESHDRKFHSDSGDLSGSVNKSEVENTISNPAEVAETAANATSSSSTHMMDHASGHCHFNHVHFHVVPVTVATNVAIMLSVQRLADAVSGQPSATPRSPFRPPIV